MKILDLFNRVYGTKALTQDEVRASVEEYKQAILGEQNPAIGQPEQQAGPEDDRVASILFTINQKGDANVQIGWFDESDRASRILGSLLYAINSGALSRSCSEMMKGIGGLQPDREPFVKKSMTTWKKCVEANTAVLKPSQSLPRISVGMTKDRE